SKYPQLEEELLEWLCELQKQLKTVTRLIISAKACNLALKQEYYTLYSNIPECQFT
ncbi:26644_t:CDS:1, partial [Dentiscutata erythropus]